MAATIVASCMAKPNPVALRSVVSDYERDVRASERRVQGMGDSELAHQEIVRQCMELARMVGLMRDLQRSVSCCFVNEMAKK